MSLKAHDALANLAAHAQTLPEPYLVTGPQAAYLYHRWLSPISKMIDLSIPPESLATWQATLSPPWAVHAKPPSYTELQKATRMAILEPHLTKKRYARRVVYQSLSFISREDLCVDLLRNAKTSLGFSEIADLLIKQKETLDWSYLLSQIEAEGLDDRLREIIGSINQVAGRSVIATHLCKPTPAGRQNREIRTYLDDSLIDILQPLDAQSSLITSTESPDVQPA